MLLRGTMLIAVALALVAPAAASAASKPEVRTGAVANITPTTATLNGRVDPNGAATTYYFQYGTTSLYGTNTAATSAGAGANAVGRQRADRRARARHDVPLPPRRPNSHGIARGADRTFRTQSSRSG